MNNRTSYADCTFTKNGKKYGLNTFASENNYCMELVDTAELIESSECVDDIPTFHNGNLGVTVEYPRISFDSVEEFFTKHCDKYSPTEIDEAFEYGSGSNNNSEL